MSISVGLIVSEILPVTHFFNTNEGSNVNEEEVQDVRRQQYIQVKSHIFSMEAAEQKFSDVGTIRLLVRIFTSKVGVSLSVVGSFVVPALLWSSFMKRFVKVILSTELRIIPFNFKLVAVLPTIDLPENLTYKY